MKHTASLQSESSGSGCHLDGFVNKALLAKHYRVSTRSIDNWMSHRLIPFTKIGGVVRFDIAKVGTALARFEVK